MQKRKSIINVPLTLGAMLSVTLHAAALYYRGIYTPPEPIMDSGRTVVHLTLMPSISSSTEIKEPESVEKTAETTVSPASSSAAQPEPESKPLKTVEQDGSLQEEKGIITEAATTGTFKPSYPRISRRRGEEGTVTLSIQVFGSGQAGRVTILTSSGFSRLDQAACQAARQTTYIPAKQFDRHVESALKLSFTFRLTDD